jgi:hypothetical protein
VLKIKAYYPTDLGTYKTPKYTISDGTNSVTVNLPQINGDNLWHSYEIPIPAAFSASSTQLIFRIGCRDFNNKSFYIDDVILEINPENCVTSQGNNELFTDIQFLGNNLKLGDAGNIFVYNLVGQCVMQGKNSSEYDLSALKTGVYLVKAVINNKYFNLKIIKN